MRRHGDGEIGRILNADCGVRNAESHGVFLKEPHLKNIKEIFGEK
jgi:hypothetical protein